MRYLFLYTEFAPYMEACLLELCDQGNQVMLLQFPKVNEAPFIFKTHKNLTTYGVFDNSKIFLKHEINIFQPDKIIVAGWTYRFYLQIALKYYKKIPTILTLDNEYIGSTKQIFLSLISPFTLKKIFSHIFVPGQVQKRYAYKLNFGENTISTGLYCADTKLFSKIYEQRENRQTNIKYFLFAGRYVPEKNIEMLWDAFLDFKKQTNSNWELICCGQGPLFNKRKTHPSIKHLGFKQPHELHDIVVNAGCFVLPSAFEPWGVVVHEMATAGLPIICSNRVGSKEMVANGKSGFIFNYKNKNHLINCLSTIAGLSEQELLHFGENSHEKAISHNTRKWVKILEKIKL